MSTESSFVTPEIIKDVKWAMDRDKYFLIPNAYSESFCEAIRTQMDQIEEGVGVEFNYGGTEMRAWSSQKRSQKINQFYTDSNKLMSAINNTDCQAGTVLAIKNNALEQSDELNQQGRWHIDSWRSQEKVFLFLNDTTEESGPFEFIPNTHKTCFRMRKALTPGFFFDFQSLLKKNVPRPYQSIDEDRIKALISNGYHTTPVLVKAGTLMVVNPSYLIHRARPCLKGQRYALTAYYGVKQGYKDYNI